MEILFIAPHINPFDPPINGDTQRTQLLLKACATIAHVDIVCFQENVISNIKNVNVIYSHQLPHMEVKPRRIQKWITLICPWNIEAFFTISKSQAITIDNILQKKQYDFIVSRYLYRSISCGLWKYRHQLIIDFDDSLSFYFQQLYKSAKHISSKIRYCILKHESNLITHFAIKSIHHAFFSNSLYVKNEHASFLPNIPFYKDITCDNTKFSATEKNLLFVGQLDYEPNTDGINHFLKYVYTPLRTRIPNVKLLLVGKLNNDKLKKEWEKYPNVQVVGFVKDIQQAYDICRVAIVPIYSCGGTNIKLLEALQMNRACVATYNAAHGYGETFINKQDAYIVHNDTEFIDALEILLMNDDICAKIASNGHNTIKKYYSFNSFCSIVRNGISGK